MTTELSSVMLQIQEVQEELNNNFEKVKAGNKSAAQRARKNTLTLAKLYKDFRAESIKI